MSDHPGSAPERGYETQDASISTIVFTGCILVAFGIVSLVAVWGLYRHFQRRANRANRELNERLPLVHSELEQRLAAMNKRPPHPRLEGFEPAHARVVLETAEGKEQNFYVDTPITVVRRQGGEEKLLDLYDLLPGTEVSLTYQDPQGVYGRPRVVRIEVGGEAPGAPAGPTEGGLLSVGGEIKKIDPESGPDFRAAAEADLGRAGWVDRKKDIAHIPIEQAMQILVDRHLLKSKPAKEEGERR
jgi:hypothetical protein